MKKRLFLIKVIMVFCTVVLLVTTATSVKANDTGNAQNSMSLGVSPAIFELVLEPGVEKSTKIFVHNNTDSPIPIKAQVLNFIPSESLSELTKEQLQVFDASTWFEVEPYDFILQPETYQEVLVKVNPPEDAQPGGNYATVFFQPLLADNLISAQNTYVTAKIGVLALLKVKGDIIESAQVKDFTASPKAPFGPTEFNITLENTGNIHLLPTGTIAVKNMFNKEVGTFDLKPSIVLPHTGKNFSAEWDQRWILGKYTASVQITYGSDPVTLIEDEIIFWAVPWLFIITVVLPLTMLLTTLIIFRRRFFMAVKVLTGKAYIPMKEKNKKINSNFEGGESH
jgi:hypothetical protein